MKIALVPVLAALALAGCATPVVMLKNDINGQVVRCGGGVAGSIAGGLIGHNIEKASDENCVRDFEARGFKRTEAARDAEIPARRAPLTTAPTVPIATAPKASGQYSYQVERLSDAKACNPNAAAVLSGKGPGVETYTVACTNGDVLTVRCEVSSCRVLR